MCRGITPVVWTRLSAWHNLRLCPLIVCTSALSIDIAAVILDRSCGATRASASGPLEFPICRLRLGLFYSPYLLSSPSFFARCQQCPQYQPFSLLLVPSSCTYCVHILGNVLHQCFLLNKLQRNRKPVGGLVGMN